MYLKPSPKSEKYYVKNRIKIGSVKREIIKQSAPSMDVRNTRGITINYIADLEQINE